MTMAQTTLTEAYLNDLQAENAGRYCVVGALITNAEKKIFVQKRALDRRLFPGCWDIAGGHVESGESLYEALRREIQEETGWELQRLLAVVDIFEWPSGDQTMREFDFLVEVTGDLNHAVLEAGKFTEYRWIGLDEIEILLQNRTPADDTIYRLVRRALEIVG